MAPEVDSVASGGGARERFVSMAARGEEVMNPVQCAAFNGEIAQAKRLIASGDLNAAFAHLERAHVVGQAYVRPHVTAHGLMLQVELRRRRPAAVLGQAIRIVLGALGSAVGIVPTGNTGGTDISMFKRLPVETELQNIIAGRAAGEGSRRSDS
jgi:hypothetical protein